MANGSFWKSGRVPGEVELAYGRVGEGANPILALHGITAQHRAYNAVARRLAHPDGMVALDLRGRGDSEKPPPGNYGLDAHVGDVVRALDHLGVERGILCGHSMGAFVALRVALLHPDRVSALALLDGGWPRPEEEPDEADAAAIQEGLERAFRRLDMVFETPEDYLNFWFPNQNLTYDDLPPDLADYYRYDLQGVEGGYQPKASIDAAREDSDSVSSGAPTLEEMKNITHPVSLVRAAEGFFPGTAPLISDETRDAMLGALNIRSETVVPGTTHYTMMFEPSATTTAGFLDSRAGS
ncbi:alpha/beta fold hydrolase [Rubrobacter marinus]|uniref:Alpha/beta fold hydrolase n=1 Tax=Rubrobacter marinus TaxID=2653852 RepID=A0A6G8PWM2_9ACTN|nr:alpha/beta hydrolase [Rubrobacter marinus]QIN78586.1 alpha/beta fold hydrolase [Rubrobacter marinus]